MTDTSAEHMEEAHNSAAETAEARQERRFWGGKFWRRIGIAGGALLLAATLPHLLPVAAGWLAAPFVAAHIPGIASVAAAASPTAGTAALAGEWANYAQFAGNWLAPLAGVIGGLGLIRSIGPGAKYAAAITR